MCLRISLVLSFKILYEKVILANKSSHSYCVANLEKINALIVWFFSSEFKWLCLVAGDIYLHCDSLGEVGELNDVRVAGDGLAGGTE